MKKRIFRTLSLCFLLATSLLTIQASFSSFKALLVASAVFFSKNSEAYSPIHSVERWLGDDTKGFTHVKINGHERVYPIIQNHLVGFSGNDSCCYTPEEILLVSEIVDLSIQLKKFSGTITDDSNNSIFNLYTQGSLAKYNVYLPKMARLVCGYETAVRKLGIPLVDSKDCYCASKDVCGTASIKDAEYKLYVNGRIEGFVEKIDIYIDSVLSYIMLQYNLFYNFEYCLHGLEDWINDDYILFFNDFSSLIEVVNDWFLCLEKSVGSIKSSCLRSHSIDESKITRIVGDKDNIARKNIALRNIEKMIILTYFYCNEKESEREKNSYCF